MKYIIQVIINKVSYTVNTQDGRSSFSKYYTAAYTSASLARDPRKRTTATHVFVLTVSKLWTLGWAENACFFIKFRISQTLGEILLIHRKKGILPKFQLI